MPIETVTLPDGACDEGPCQWEVLLCESTDPEDSCYAGKLDELDAATRTLVLQAAVTQLWECSGRRFSTCPVTIRTALREDCSGWDWTYGAPWTPYLDGGQWYNRRQPCGSSCGEVCELVLPGGQICDVTEVLVDGRELKSGEYEVHNRRRLVRTREPQLTAGELGVSFFFLGGNPASSPVEICDVTQTPDALAGWEPGGPVAGCYEQALTSSNPDFDYLSASSVGFRVKRNQTDTVSFVVGALNGTDQYQFPTATQLNAPGQSMESTVRSDGSWLRVTLVSGPGTVQRIGNPLVVGGDPTILLERFELALGGCWPTCQNVAAPADVSPSVSSESAGTLEVTYTKGTAVPPGGQIAAGVLAVELARACLGDPGCRLPQRVTSISRQGVSMALLDPDVGTDCRTGLYQVDAWLDSVTNPRARFGSAVINPQGLGRHRRTTSNG